MAYDGLLSQPYQKNGGVEKDQRPIVSHFGYFKVKVMTVSYALFALV